MKNGSSIDDKNNIVQGGAKNLTSSSIDDLQVNLFDSDSPLPKAEVVACRNVNHVQS